MWRAEYVFIAFAVLLILGIFVLMKPHVFVLESQSDIKSTDTKSEERIVPHAVVMLGSVLIIAGLVGLSVFGFRLFKDLMAEANSERS